MDNSVSLALVVGIAVVTNTLYDMEKSKSPITALLGGTIVYVILAVIGGLTNQWKLVQAFAFVFLFGSLLFHGKELGDTLTSFTTPSTSSSATPPSSSSTQAPNVIPFPGGSSGSGSGSSGSGSGSVSQASQAQPSGSSSQYYNV